MLCGVANQDAARPVHGFVWAPAWHARGDDLIVDIELEQETDDVQAASADGQ